MRPVGGLGDLRPDGAGGGLWFGVRPIGDLGDLRPDSDSVAAEDRPAANEKPVLLDTTQV